MQCPYFSVRLQAIAPDLLILKLPLANLTSEQFDRLFPRDYFLVEATFRLPLGITRPLFGYRVEIAAGHYPFTVQNGIISIRFRVTPSTGTPSALA
jgi:hypothetical protein